MRRPLLLALALAASAACAAAATAAAQATPADSAAILYDAVRRLEVQGQYAAARALLQLIARQYPGTPAADEAARQLADRTRRTRETSGRGQLIVWYTIYGAWLGILVPSALGADEPEPYGLGLLVGAPTGFLVSRSYGRSTTLSSGQARAIAFGSQWGTWQGLAWREVLDIGERTATYCYGTGGGPPCYSFETDSDRAPWTAMLIGGVGGAVTAAVLARGRDIPGGAATFAIHSSLWGTWYGLAGSILGNANGTDATLAWTLVGGNLGLLTGALAAPRDISSGRVWLITAGGIGGLAAGLGLDLLIQPDNDQVAIGIPTATSALGLILATQWTRAYDSDIRPQGAAEPGAALLNVRGGRFHFGIPAVTPAVLPRDLDRRSRPGLAFRVPLFELRH